MELFKLCDSDDNIITENETESWCWKYIMDYAKSKDLGYYYRKSMLDDGTEVIDYGSHTHFFYIKSERVDAERTCARYEVLDDDDWCKQNILVSNACV